MKKIIFLFVAFCFSFTSYSQRVYTDYGAIDIQKYEFHISVNDNNNDMQGKANINLVATSNLEHFKLDLENTDETKKGMVVTSVSENGNPVKFEHQDNVLTIFSNITSGEEKTFSVTYHGIPKDGLVISKNKYGDRTFFGDNWPNRAHQWLPTVDHPSDKALVEWHVTAPSHYQVVGNGTQVEETDLDNQNTYYVWKTDVPIPTKVMVIGIARFAVQHIGETHNIPISSWVYPQNKEAGFYDYAMGKDIINFFIENVGPYPYSKLANVQSKTRFGGMENASNIFYFENSVSGERKIENLIAHEIAHQWFGNSASESDWTHVWLSEGFATYFTNLYVEKTKGREAFLELVHDQRNAVIKFSKQQLTPVLDTETKSLMRLLNANSYRKGAWVLHMLRKKVGDVPFWNSIRAYYKKYALKNASSNDLKNVFEDVTNQELDAFFTQWLEQPGHPILKTSWKSNVKTLTFNIEQTQETDVVFAFPLELKLVYEDDSSEIMTLSVKDKKATAKIEVKGNVKDVVIDPNSWLLFESGD